MIVALVFGPTYWLVVRRSFQTRDVYDMEEHDLAQAFDIDADIIKENQGVTGWERVGRFVFSYTLFIIFLIMS